jgi:phosphinothricin acetyltransferase
VIRKAKNSDAQAIADIYNYYIQTSVSTFEEEVVCVDEISTRIELVENYGYPWLVAEENGNLIGFAYATRWNKRSAYKNTVEISVYISNAVSSSGWGTKLYETLFSELRNHSIHIVVAGITLPNPVSIALHEKFGMKKVAHFKEVGYKFGQWLDVGYWQLHLSSDDPHENDV